MPYSPELVANLGQDYTVYAYDYSEQDTPLVGQGMLSWALASAASAPGASTPPTRAVITGRVCKHILGLFSNGATDTLEVKLRLIPVPRCLQSEFIRSMEMYRSLSRTMPAGFDAAAWTSFLQANPSLCQQADNSKDSRSSMSGDQRNDVGMETLSQIMNHGLSSPSMTQNFDGSIDRAVRNPNSLAPSTCGDMSRTASPLPSYGRASGPYDSLVETPSRPASQASNSAFPQSLEGETSSGRQTETGAEDLGSKRSVEDGPSKKRARTTKTDWRGRGSLGANSEPLRVTASTAASMRILRPIAIKPSEFTQAPLQEPPREPTPRPEEPNAARGRSRPMTQSRLSSGSLQGQRPPSRAWSQVSERGGTYQNAAAAFADNAANSGPANSLNDIASSPPTLDRGMMMPSSPVLPTLPRQVDSGYMSGPVEHPFEEEDEMRPIDKEDLEVAAQYSKRRRHPVVTQLTIEEVTPGPPELLPTRMLPRHIPGQRKKVSRAPSAAASEPPEPPQVFPAPAATGLEKPSGAEMPRPQSRASLEDTMLPAAGANRPSTPLGGPIHTPSMGALTLPPQTASDPAGPSNSQLWSEKEGQRSQSLNEVHGMVADATQSGNERASQPRSGSGAKRKKAIQRRLAIAIESGVMPPFCDNCGAIETPTWRKAWSKRLDGSPDDIRITDEEGGVLAIRDEVKDATGKTTSFCILKKCLLDCDEDFNEIHLCNRKWCPHGWWPGISGANASAACGLWFHKFKCMRPEHKWNKESKDPSEKRKRTSRKRKPSAAPAGDALAATSPDEARSQSDTAPVSRTPEEYANKDHDGSTVAGPPLKRSRAASDEPRQSPRSGQSNGNQTSSAAALKRYIQSSPARMLGTQFSPIDVDDLGSTRRILFPSPKKPEGARPLQDITMSANQRPSKLGSGEKAVLNDSPTSSDKENRLPQTTEDDDLAALFEDDGGDEGPPSTPKRKTPVRSGKKGAGLGAKMSNHESSPWRFELSSNGGRERTLAVPRTPNSRDHHNKSPRSGRASVQYSPFTAHMYQLLSEANNNGSPSSGGGGSGGGLAGLDFASLPALGDILPVAGTPLHHTPTNRTSSSTSSSSSSTFRLSDLSAAAAGDLFSSTDLPMPSSPPGFFSLYKDPTEPTSGLWSDFDIPPPDGSPAPARTVVNKGSREGGAGDGAGDDEDAEEVNGVFIRE